MNIFVLDENPILAARMHCDQHIHKMILESAQMLSTACHIRKFDHLFSDIYRPAYQNHPCTLWVANCPGNMYWLCTLALELDQIRLRKGAINHKSIAPISLVRDYLRDKYPKVLHLTPFVAAMPVFIRTRPSLSITQKYQEYYKYKHRQWLDTNRPMTYTFNPVPKFMENLYHGNENTEA